MVLNNEDGFKYENVESICTVGESTKKKYKQMGYIGEKGLGFKSVFQVGILSSFLFQHFANQ